MVNRQVAIVHMTSAHPRFDTRIFVKQCQSLAQTGFSVHLIVADGLGDQVKNGVCIHDVGRPASRVRRVLDKTRSVFKLSLE